MPSHLTPKECQRVDELVGHSKLSVSAAVDKINSARRRADSEEIGYSAVCKYVRGESHRRDRPEKRGRKKILKPSDVRKLNRVRKSTIKQARSQKRVVWKDIHLAAGYENTCSLRTVQRAVRKTGVKYRKAREKIYISEDDAKVRLVTCKEWLEKPGSFWEKQVHAWIDHKGWVVPLTEKQREKYSATKVTGHLRLPEEGVNRCFTRPRQQHSFLGIPSVIVGAAVAGDKVICWDVIKGPWNGEKAKTFYKDALVKALKKTYPGKRKFLIVEDGDRKGYQSGKGIAAKEEMKIASMVLPPRSPSLMPLDASLWTKIEKKFRETQPTTGTESKEAFLARLRKAAKSLPAGTVATSIKRTKACLQAIVAADGFIPKND